jgi:outer membrane protein assembly factor BamB
MAPEHSVLIPAYSQAGVGLWKSVTNWSMGLTVYDPTRCWPGYTLLTPFSSPIVYLLDMNGEVVHMWFISLSPNERTTVVAKYIGDGHILFKSEFDTTEAWGEQLPVDHRGTWFTEIDWNGEIVWSYAPGGSQENPHNARGRIGWDPKRRVVSPHHDVQRLTNGNTLMLVTEWVTNPAISDHELRSDYFLEVMPDGTPVWIWHSDEHFDEFGFSPETRRLISDAPGTHMGNPLGDYLHTNTVEVLPETDLGRCNPRFRAGNILSCQRNTNTIYIVDRESDEVVWTWGQDQLVGPHHPIMLPNGHILIYDNGGQAGYPRRTRTFTRLVELDPVSGEILWTYVLEPRRFHHHKFFSPTWGSVQRLPNGNTLSLDANRGRLFEITPDGEIVWEYVNGFMGMFHFRGMKRLESGVYRCYRLPYNAIPDFSSDFEQYLDGKATLLQVPPIT